MPRSLNLGYKIEIFDDDFFLLEEELSRVISRSSFLIIGGAGSIGQEVVKLISSYSPPTLHVIDISENNTVELVRELRAGGIVGYCDFRTFIIDVGSVEFDVFTENSRGKYDYVINLSAMKHVRSERDIYTLMRILRTNVLNTQKLLTFNEINGVKKFFSVSTDKAANPVNIMGASKKIMEMLMFETNRCETSSARFANVAFSDGSLLFGIENRIRKRQAIVVPTNIKRYFISKSDAAKLCAMAAIIGRDREIYFSNLDPKRDLVPISDVILNYLGSLGLSPDVCSSPDEAIEKSKKIGPSSRKWPCFFSETVTSGEKMYEEFFAANDHLVQTNYKNVGIIRYSESLIKAEAFVSSFIEYYKSKDWDKACILNLIEKTVGTFSHIETGKNLDEGM